MTWFITYVDVHTTSPTIQKLKAAINSVFFVTEQAHDDFNG